ncbi:MAG TPA: PQQ-binding-like beta-propeller repeat protein [Candidatus Acidoferrales bacterium]|nr:PQQ-binding-like beta-propeller repeat protein [Candidatus Acidoferrales bacterium]
MRCHTRFPIHASLAALLFAVAAGPLAAGQDKSVANKEGEALYGERCAACHDAGVSRAPSRAAMSEMPPEGIQSALTTGRMSSQGANLTAEQIDAVSHFLSSQAAAQQSVPSEEFFCHAGGRPFAPQSGQPQWNGWGTNTSESRFQPAEMARLRADQVPRLKLKWAFGFVDTTQAYAQPAVVGGRIFVGSAGRRVYSLDAASGCMYWQLGTEAAVRTAISVGANGSGWAAYFGDQHANAYAVDAITGKLLWKTRMDEHPAAQITGAPLLVAGRLYVTVSSLEEVTGADAKYECCKFRGSVSALDAATGKVLWKSYTIPEEPKPFRKNRLGVQLWGPSGAGVWSSPTVDLKSKRIYVTTGDSYSDPPADTSDAFVAFDLETGKLLWSSQMWKRDAYNIDCDIPGEKQANCPESKGPDFDFGSSPILVNLANGRRALIAGAKSGIVYAVDADRDGALLWQKRVGHGGTLGGVQWGSAADAKNVYVALSDVERRPSPAGSPAGQDSVFGVKYELDPKTGGGLFALKLDTGETAWHTPHPDCDRPGCSPAQSAAVTAIPGVVFSGGVDGHLRAYSASDGRIIWDVDTMREYKTVNGVKAKGGSLDGPGAVVAGGMLYVNSGYFFQGSASGNVLLAFSVDGE